MKTFKNAAADWIKSENENESFPSLLFGQHSPSIINTPGKGKHVNSDP